MRARNAMYRRWYNMLSRCENPGDKEYPNYGGRGIRVCERWHDLDVFVVDLLVEIGPWPGPGYSLDRKNNDGDYEPGNVRWATGSEQLYNSRQHYERRPIAAGERFGALVVVCEAEPVFSRNRSKPNGMTTHRAVLCLCDCGTEAVVKVGNLPRTYSCGCLKRTNMQILAAERFGPGGEFYGSGNRVRWSAAPD